MEQPTPHTLATVQITTLGIVGMSCGGCARKVTTALDALEGVVHVAVDLRKAQAIVEHLPVYSGAPSLVTAVRNAGYSAHVVDTVDDIESATSQSPATGGCRCGCVQSRQAQRSFDLGTSTIG